MARVGAPSARGSSAHKPAAKEAARPRMGVNSYDKEMAELAKKRAMAESKAAGGAYVSTKGGHFSIGGNIVKGDKIRCVVVDSIFSNVFYPDAYDANVQASPVCYAYGETDAELAPHAESEDPQHEKCAGCPCNAYGTANTGTGKACKNQRRLALILEDDLAAGDEAQMYTLNVAVTSTRAWGSYVNDVADTFARPVAGVLTEIEIYTAPGKTHAQLSFACERELEQEELAMVLPRRNEAMELLTIPFPKREEPEKKTTVRRAPAPAVRKTGPAAGATKPKFRR